MSKLLSLSHKKPFIRQLYAKRCPLLMDTSPFCKTESAELHQCSQLRNLFWYFLAWCLMTHIAKNGEHDSPKHSLLKRLTDVNLAAEWINSPLDLSSEFLQFTVNFSNSQLNKTISDSFHSVVVVRYALKRPVIFSPSMVADDRPPVVHKRLCLACCTLRKLSISFQIVACAMPNSAFNLRDALTTSQLETLMDVLHNLDDFDDPRNCLQTSRIVVEVCLEDALLSCLRPALNRLLEQRLEELLSWLAEQMLMFYWLAENRVFIGSLLIA
ncbi:hypothetical protein T12_23 [Trichinella patagoniensis]|uniref:Uncharacterized protein n=1 Tax=Trichinella patagoniensis TaxID=990121 RepID=A0A0V0Z8M3_9BILA|nr:hypothetical protein T12_23 [Trichinella patagoniensis]